MAIPLWDPNHPRGRVFMRQRHDLMSKLNNALPELREMDTEGLWTSLQKYDVMDRTILERCRAGGISADQIERVVECLKKDLVWKFHAFVKVLYDIGRTAYIDILLGKGASTNYEDQPAKHTGRSPMQKHHGHNPGTSKDQTRSGKVQTLSTTTLTSAEGAGPEKASPGPHLTAEVLVTTAKGPVQTAKLTGDEGTTTKATEDHTKETHADGPSLKLKRGQIYFGKNLITSEETKQSLKTAFKQNERLREMKFEQGELTNEVADSVRTFLQKNTTLQTLDFSRSGFSAECMCKLMSALGDNKSLVSLGFRNSEFSDAMMEELCQFIQENKSMEILLLDFSNFSDSVMSQLFWALRDNKNLTALEFDSRLKDDSVVNLGNFIEKNNSLKELWFVEEDFTDDGVTKLLDSLQENESLRELWIHLREGGDEYVPVLNEFLRSAKFTKVRSVYRGKHRCLEVYTSDGRDPSYYNIVETDDGIRITAEEEVRFGASSYIDGDPPETLTAGECNMQIEPTEPSSVNRDPEDEVYEMGGNTSGRCLIINVMKAGRREPRTGSEIDSSKLKTLFERFKFEVTRCTDEDGLSQFQLRKTVQQFLKTIRPQNCAIICLMSHGDADYIYGTDDEKVELKDIINNMAHCSTLGGKPKLIFVQACSGERDDHGQGWQARERCRTRNSGINSSWRQGQTGHSRGRGRQGQLGTAQGTSSHDGPCRTNDPAQQGASAQQSSKLSALPTRADMFIGRSSARGYVSFRYPEGSWYIQAIVEVFGRFADKNDLSRLMIKVRADVSEREHNGCKQLPESIDYLLKELYFNCDVNDEDD